MVKTRKMLSLLLAGVMLLSMTACGPKQTNPTGPSESQPAADSNPAKPSDDGNTAAGVNLPIVDSPKHISIWYALQANQLAAGVKDLAEVTCVKELERRTNIVVDWQLGNHTNLTDQFNLMIAGGKLPDAFMYKSGTEVASRLASDGVIMELGDLVRKNAPNICKFLDENPELRDSIIGANGEMYSIPAYDAAGGTGGIYGCLTVRKDWLDKVNLPVPTTVEEYYTAMKAFKDNDVNGNGEADEIPLCIGGNNVRTIGFSSFCLWPFGIHSSYMQIDGKACYGPYTQEYKKAMAQAQKLMQAGLLDPDFASQKLTQVEKKIAANLGGSSQGRMHIKCTQIKQQVADTIPDYNMVIMPYLREAEGKPAYYFAKDPSKASVAQHAFYISSTSKNAEDIIRWLDYQFTEEGGILMNFGLEGESLIMKDGTPTLNIEVLRDPSGMILTSNRSKYALAGDGSSVWPCYMPEVKKVDGHWPEFVTVVAGSEELFETAMQTVSKVDCSRILPAGLMLTESEASTLAKKGHDIDLYVQQMTYKFITGEESLDNFDDYLAQLKKMGIEECIGIYQAALDRFYKGK